MKNLLCRFGFHKLVWGEKEIERFSRPWLSTEDGLPADRISYTENVQYGTCSVCGFTKRRRLR